MFSVCTNRSTIEGYATAFRKIVADLFGLAADPAKFDYQSGGRDEWLAKVHGIRLSEITPAKIQEWKQSFLATAGAGVRAKAGPCYLSKCPRQLTIS